MLALIAGQGALPQAVADAARAGGTEVLLCEMRGFPLEVTGGFERMPFRIEQLGSFLVQLRAQGVDRVCMAGAVRRPPIDSAAIDAATLPLVPRIQSAIAKGDDGALREVIAIFEEAGLAVVAAHEIAPDLLPPQGVLTKQSPPSGAVADARAGAEARRAMGRADLGQACIVRDGRVLGTEGDEGTDALIGGGDWTGAVLVKGPKPGQDRRADLPTIGPGTARAAIRAGLSGIVLEAGGVIVLDLPAVLNALDRAGLWLWVRESDG